MIIQSIVKIPRFIGEYFNIGLLSDRVIAEFSETLKRSYFTLDNDRCYICTLKEKPEFIDFYINKSKLDDKYECIYENEIDIPKSIYNEIYVIEIDDGRVLNISLKYNDENDCLILNIED